MIKYEIKKIFSPIAGIVLVLSFIALVGASILFMKNSSLDVKNNEKYYSEITEYSEEEYSDLIKERDKLYTKIFEAEDETEKAQIKDEFSAANAKIDIYEKIYNRIFNIQVFTTYKNWETGLKYSYDVNESYSIENTSMWEAFFKYSIYEYISLAIIIILVIMIYTSDNKEGNRKVVYSTYKGENAIRSSKRILTYIGSVIVTFICMMVQLVVSICMGMDISIIDVGLYQLDNFPFAPSYMCIGDYLLYAIMGHVVFNLMVVAFIDMITSFVDKKIFIIILTLLYMSFLTIFSEAIWLNPIRILNTIYYFDNVREITAGGLVFHQYLITVIVIMLLIVLFRLFAKLAQMLKLETE